MLTIDIPKIDLYDEKNFRFICIKPHRLTMEHSLVSLSKWEAKWKEPFISKKQKTRAQTCDYVRCMTITQNVDERLWDYLPDYVIQKVNEYIADPMTATWFREENRKGQNREQITAELIYYWMVAFNIPPEYQKWHLNRLLTLIRVCSEKNKPQKKRKMNDVYRHNDIENERRKAMLRSKG